MGHRGGRQGAGTWLCRYKADTSTGVMANIQVRHVSVHMARDLSALGYCACPLHGESACWRCTIRGSGTGGERALEQGARTHC